MKFSVLIPVADNDHKPFSKSKLTSITTRLALQFGGRILIGASTFEELRS